MQSEGKDGVFISLTREVIKEQHLIDLVRKPECGGICTFFGTTRNEFDGKRVLKLEYEAYEPMAKKEILKLIDQAKAKWPIQSIAVVHRLGEVPVKETSIGIAVSSPHRLEAFRATQFLIDRIKDIVPIWKKECLEDGSALWKENCSGCSKATQK